MTSSAEPASIVTGTRPAAVWITGLSASGKSTLGTALRDGLLMRGYRCCLLDGEVLRARLDRQGHSLGERYAVLREIVAVAAAEQQRGRIPIVATISHKRDMRTYAKQALGAVLEVYLDCAASICASRDGKGHYQRAYAGDYACFVGVTEPYETWEEAGLVIDTARLNAAEATRVLLDASLDFLGVPSLCPSAPAS